MTKGAYDFLQSLERKLKRAGLPLQRRSELFHRTDVLVMEGLSAQYLQNTERRAGEKSGGTMIAGIRW